VGAFSAAIFHLMTHAFFKALLFLGAGSVIHALGGEQDLGRMGGLRRHLPVTYGTFLLGTLAITGVPGFSGFFSKDEILWKAYGEGNPFGLGGKVLWGVGVVTAGMTAVYMFRLLLRAFYGEARYGEAAAHHLHESPRAMAVPLVVLGVLSVAGGWVGIPRSLSFGADLNAFEHYLTPVFGEAAGEAGANAPALEWGLMVLALAGVGAGILLAARFYLQKPELPERIVERFPTLSRLLLNKYYVDELYQRIIIGPYERLCEAFNAFDKTVVDGTVNAAGTGTEVASQVLKLFQTGSVRNYALFLFLGALALLWYLG